MDDNDVRILKASITHVNEYLSSEHIQKIIKKSCREYSFRGSITSKSAGGFIARCKLGDIYIKDSVHDSSLKIGDVVFATCVSSLSFRAPFTAIAIKMARGDSDQWTTAVGKRS